MGGPADEPEVARKRGKRILGTAPAFFAERRWVATIRSTHAHWPHWRDLLSVGEIDIDDRFTCGFNWSLQHLISNHREENVEDEAGVGLPSCV